jgi:hypothetical protein
MSFKEAALRRSRALWVRRERDYKAKAAHAHTMHKRREAQLAALTQTLTWHPDATHIPHIDAGEFTSGGHKLVWHTTETTGLPDYGGSSPHFTIEPHTGRLWQHIPIDRAARSLKAGGPNLWNTIQVEIIGSAKDSQDWPAAAYAHLAELARWIERNAGVPRRCAVTFTGSGGVHRLSNEDFHAYAGHIGHQHAPAPNDHWDPGKLRIDSII